MRAILLSLGPVLGICLLLPSCGFLTRSGINAPVERKVVVAKEPPNRLIAQDQTQCAVPESRFESVVIGNVVSCVWFEVP